MNIRKLTADEIECRVAQIRKTSKGKAWCTLLLYKDARVDQNLLDETFGPMNWRREHTMIGERLYCTVSVWDEQKGQWVSKQDVGTESYTEKEKGQASDSFKRACFNWGIGRELYSAPNILIWLEDGEYTESDNGKISLSRTSFTVSGIGYDAAGRISRLVISDSNGRSRFTFGAAAPARNADGRTQEAKDTGEKPVFDQNHRLWQQALDKIVAGQGSIADLQKKYCVPSYAEAAIKDYISQKLG